MLCDRTLDSTKGCAALKDVHDSFGYRLSHRWDILGQVDGSITVKRENGCLSTATSFTWVSMWAEPAALPSGRGYGTTCAKVWNVETIAFL